MQKKTETQQVPSNVEARIVQNEKPMMTEIGSAETLVQSYTYGNGPDGYTGYYKYH